MSVLFISHRSTDKEFADIFTDFLLRCGIKSDHIFCSSLPGNDVKIDIPVEIKRNLQMSVVNVVLLSADYYKSTYCANEAGIIWYLDVPKIIIALPEINENIMEGFLNSDNKIRRLDIQYDILAISDIISPLFSDFIIPVTKLSSNASKLVEAYKTALQTRVAFVPKENQPRTNSLEDSILEDNFIAEELVALRYLYDTKTDIFKQDESTFLEWVMIHGIQITSSIDISEYLADAGIASKIRSEWESTFSVQLSNDVYRNLMKLSKKALDFMDKSILSLKINQNSTQTPVNNMDQLIINGFTDNEMLFIKYALGSERVKFMCGWQFDQEIQRIQAWEDVNSIERVLSKNYGPTLDRLLMRKIIRISQLTSNNNPKEYELTDQSFMLLSNLSSSSKIKLDGIVEKYKIIDIDDKMPF